MLKRGNRVNKSLQFDCLKWQNFNIRKCQTSEQKLVYAPGDQCSQYSGETKVDKYISIKEIKKNINEN